MANVDVERLVNQCKLNDVDAKIDAVTKLQQQFEAGSELFDVDGLITVLKSSLRTSNQHLTTVTLSALPSFFPLLVNDSHDPTHGSVDAATLRLALVAFLPSGGIIDRLGDSRERAREKARESLVVLGGLALRANGPTQGSVKQKDTGKGPETPLMIWERFVRENGLQSKVWRVREQAIFTLVQIRRIHHAFPLRPYLSHLVEALEDTDGTVRECARQSVVKLFTGPGVTDGARADLKKEMARKGVRKTIVDSVLLKLLSNGPNSRPQSEGSENGDTTKKEYVPPSLTLMNRRPTAGSAGTGVSRTFSQTTVSSLAESTSRPSSRLAGELPSTPTGDGVEVQSVYVASSKDLENEFTQMLKHFEGKETEHNWAARERSVIRIRGMIKGEAHIRYPETFLLGLKGGVLDGTLKALASLRTTVSANTCALYTDLASHLGLALDPFCETLLTHLLRMACFTKKIAATQSQAVITAIITHTSAHPRVTLNLLWNTMQDKNVQARTFVINHVKTYMEVHGQRLKLAIEAAGGVDLLERCIRKGLADPNTGVRENARLTFWVFEGVWRERGLAIIGSLDATARKQLEKVCPIPGAGAKVLPETPRAKKSSVAAAIAASRAKAKAIATAPPTLRHQATSTSHAVHTASTSPPTRRSASPASGRSPVGLRRSPPSSRSMSPTSPSQRISMIPQPRPISPQRVTSTAHFRSLSADSPPPSPSADRPHRRQLSSHMTTSSPPSVTLRTAMHTALPPSPTRNNSIPPSPRRTGTRSSFTAVTHNVGQNRSSLMGAEAAGEEPSLLMATAIPLPDDSDSDQDESNLLSFSAAYEKFPPNSESALSNSSTRSPPHNGTQLIVEDALRARAEQAESTAERLLELVEPDDDTHVSPIPAALLRTNGTMTPKLTKGMPGLTFRGPNNMPSTPANSRSSVLRQAALFRDSPAYSGSSLLDVLNERKHETGWWLKRMILVDKAAPLKEAAVLDKAQDLARYVLALEQSTADVQVLKQVALLCIEYPIPDDQSPTTSSFSFPSSPTPLSEHMKSLRSLDSNIWTHGKMFDRMFRALVQFLSPDKDEEELEYGLIVVWEMLEHQNALLEGHEGDIFSLLLQIRYCNEINVLEATNTIRDALTARIEPVYGLTTLHASLRTFLAEPAPSYAGAEVKSTSQAFGLIALGKFILRLPVEILEEELPRLRSTLTSALNDVRSLVVRESAAASIIASQLVLRDETQLFTLLDGLADEKKNLLTYLFDKHGARGGHDTNGIGGAEKLEKEMKRLDSRTNTPPRLRLSEKRLAVP